MDSDRLPPIDYNSLFRTAVHEACHGLRAYALNWRVHWLRATTPHQGATGVVYPLAAREVEAAYTQDPDRTRRTVVEIISVLNAPGQVLGEPLDGSDLEDQLSYRFAWEATGSPLPWVVLRHQAQQYLRAWANTPGRVAQIVSLASLLERRGYLSAGAFQAFVSPQTKRPAHTPALRPVVASRPAAPRPRGPLDLLTPENIACLLPLLYDWRTVGRAGTGLVQS
jgi:hypothetical protein